MRRISWRSRGGGRAWRCRRGRASRSDRKCGSTGTPACPEVRASEPCGRCRGEAAGPSHRPGCRQAWKCSTSVFFLTFLNRALISESPDGVARIFFLTPMPRRGFEPTSVELYLDPGPFKGRSTDWATAPRHVPDQLALEQQDHLFCPFHSH